MKTNDIFTIGHSTHPIEVFLAMLQSFEIKTLVDVRRLPGSRKYPQFDQDNLKEVLSVNNIQYIHLLDLGGRRKANKDSKNTRWNNDSFKGYADYMETELFKDAVIALEHLAKKQPTAYMCSEAVWLRCHRSMISDYLKVKGWNVHHIMGAGKSQDHKYTSPARIEDDKVLYTEPE